jgi:hypothetical protein
MLYRGLVKMISFRLIALLLMTVSQIIMAYPLDGTDYTGIQRLEGYRLGQQGIARSRKLPSGALLGMGQVQLQLESADELQIPQVDRAFSEQVRKLLRAPSYGIAVLDLTDRDNPVYAEHNAEQSFNPGSVGKLAAVMGVFQALASIYPDDIPARENVLKNTIVKADGFIDTDHHVVPFWRAEENRIQKRKLRKGDSASLWTYQDWMLSASSNAAASMVIKQLMLLEKFGQEYPVTEQRQQAFFLSSGAALGSILREGLDNGVRGGGLDPNKFRQGGFFTSGGKRRVPGGGSIATPREALRFLFNLERGRVIDAFSSLEIKRLLYLTQRRIRYASSPALYEAAVYFKSGSLYRCKPEAGFSCKKYQGNRTNLLNSVAIVESPAGDPHGLFYMVVITSNVLKHNAAVDHQTLATRLHRLIQERHQQVSALKK